MSKVTIIDYGMGNILSVQRGLERCGAEVTLTSDPELILASKRVVLPGVGAFAKGMQALDGLGLIRVIRELANRQIPLLGICLGMQLLLDESEEFGITAGLGLIPGRVIKMPAHTLMGKEQKIPHIGWTPIQISGLTTGWKGSLLEDSCPGEAFYFVHSYMAVPTDISCCIANSFYGGHKIAAVIAQDQITGCQFHPEKSGEYGLKILRKFCDD